jgi:cytochrome P450
MLLVSDATKMPVMYHRNADKANHYMTGSFGATESLFNMRDHKMHARHRRLIAAPYSFSSIKKMEPLIDVQINHWISRLDGLFASPSGAEKSFDFCPWAIYMAYDVVSEIGFGAPFGFVEQGRDVAGLIRGINDGLVPMSIMLRLHPFTTWLKNTWLGEKLLVVKPEHKNGFGALMRFRDALIAKRFADIKDGRNLRVDLLQTYESAPNPPSCGCG